MCKRWNQENTRRYLSQELEEALFNVVENVVLLNVKNIFISRERAKFSLISKFLFLNYKSFLYGPC